MEHNITEQMMHFVLQLSFILLIAKVFGEIFERYFKQPGVLGELIAGMIFGPFALGSLIKVYHVGPIFPRIEGSTLPVSNELWAFAQVAVILLLFLAGLETDLKSFVRFGLKATFIAMGGVIFPFVFGAAATAWFMKIDFMSAPALFMGAVMTATSVGITARVLQDIKKLDTPEGVTILAGAVVDDVLGILILAVVVGLAEKGEFVGKDLAIISATAFGVWLGLTFFGILLAKKIEKLFNWFRSPGSSLGLALSLCFACAAFTEMFKLAMIIGAYSIGLALSDTKLSEHLAERLEPIYHTFVPVFFVVMGMLVDFKAMWGNTMKLGLIITFLAIISKVLGCGIPALAVGFNKIGAYRIGIGMLPRGEVALIVAGIGISQGLIKADMFGVAVLMTMITTLLAPILLVPGFKGGPGLKSEVQNNKGKQT